MKEAPYPEAPPCRFLQQSVVQPFQGRILLTEVLYLFSQRDSPFFERGYPGLTVDEQLVIPRTRRPQGRLKIEHEASELRVYIHADTSSADAFA